MSRASLDPLAYVLRSGRLERILDWREPTLNWGRGFTPDARALTLDWEPPMAHGWRGGAEMEFDR
jgi:hypothetical protein